MSSFFSCDLTRNAVFTSGMEFDYDTIAARVRERAFLVPGVESLSFLLNPA